MGSASSWIVAAFQNAGLFIFWLIFPYLLAAGVMAVHRGLEDSEHPFKDALKIGQDIANVARRNLRT